MAVINGYATVDELRSEFGDINDIADTTLLEKAITTASRAIDHYTGRRFWKDTSVTIKRYKCESTSDVTIDDIASETGLVVETDSNLAGTYDVTWTLDTDYELEPFHNEIDWDAWAKWVIVPIGDKQLPVSRTLRTLRVTAIHGWSAVPADINKACLIKAAALYRRKEAPFGVAQFGEFGVRITRKDADVMDLLNPYRRLGAISV